MLKRQFVIFLAGGALSAAVDLGCMILLMQAGWKAAAAASLAFLVGLLVNYVYHARITFSAKESVGTLARYLALVAVNYLITIAMVELGERWLASAVAGKVASLPIVAVNGFLLSRYWAFK